MSPRSVSGEVFPSPGHAQRPGEGTTIPHRFRHSPCGEELFRDPNKMTIRNGLYDVEEGVESEEDTHGQAFVA